MSRSLAMALCVLGHAVVSYGVNVPITFKVIPKTVPDGDMVYVVGSDPALGSWDVTAVPLLKQKDGSWTKTVQLPAGKVVEYKITRGAWDREAVGENHQIPGNTSLKVTKAETITIKVPSWSDEFLKGQQQITGKVVYHKGMRGDGILPRDVAVWLPPSYATDAKRLYPVLYMHDGQNAFDPVTSFAGADWQVDEECTRLMAEGTLQEIIVVAIYNTPDRKEEYGPTPKGDAYMKWVVGTLKPFIDGSYRTYTTNDRTAVMGSSMGGLISFLMAWDYPDVFGQAACLSPAFGPFSNVVDRVASYAGPSKNIRIYMDNGGQGIDVKLQPGCDAMRKTLAAKGFKEGDNLAWFFDESADHGEKAWSRRVWRPLLFMYRRE